jgi:hypothetical protein
VLLIGHVTKQGKDVSTPFGSVFWHNFARMTWHVSAEDPKEVAEA